MVSSWRFVVALLGKSVASFVLQKKEKFQIISNGGHLRGLLPQPHGHRRFSNGI